MIARPDSVRWLSLASLAALAAGAGFALVPVPVLAQQSPRGSRGTSDLSAEHAPRDVLYRPAGESTPELRAHIRAAVGAVEEQALWRGLIYRLVLPEGADLATALQTLNESGLVRYAEPNWIVHPCSIPNDPQFPNQLDLNQANDADIDGPEMWDVGNGGNEVVVAVIDSGSDYTHEDLANTAWVNPGEIPFNGVDDEGDGWIDDVHGIDVVHLDGDPMDDLGHGTQVSGTIAAEADNGKGIAGICWSARIMGLKFIDSSGSGTYAGAITCLDYAVAHGVLVSNHSYEGPSFSQAMYDAFDAAGDAGHLACVAGGNSAANLDQIPGYPVCFDLPEILSVGGSDQNDDLASFSDYGRVSIDLLVPATNILSTTLGNGYGYASANSFACPHATGVAALLFSSGTTDGQRVKDWMLQAVDPFSNLASKCATSGRMNGWRAMERASFDTLATSFWSMDGNRIVANFGEALANLGDINSDGRTDLVVGSPGDKLASFSCGSIAVVSGATGATLLAVDGPPQNGARFGAAIAALGDATGDGVPDFVVGMPLANAATPVDAGGYRVVSGADGSTVAEAFGTKKDAHEGTALCGMGDLNANALGDFITGAPGVSKITARSGKNGNSIWSLTRTSTDEFGAAVANVGDRNGDGKADVLVGSPGIATAEVLSGANGATLMTINFGTADRLGATVASLGDLNGDGTGDFAVGNDARNRILRVVSGATGTLLYRVLARGGDVGGFAAVAPTTDRDRDHKSDFWVAWRGLDAAELHSGLDGSLLQVIEGATASNFGFSLLADADLDGDGEWDVVAGAPTESPSSGINAGRIHAYASEQLTLSITPSTPNEGDDVTLLCMGGESGAPILLIVTNISGVPTFEILLSDYMGAFGRYEITDTIPPGTSGESFTIQTWSIKYVKNRLISSNPFTVYIQ